MTMKDKDYDLVSTLYHALQGMETCGVYQKDAEKEGDSEIAQFHKETQESYRNVAKKAKELLKSRL